MKIKISYIVQRLNEGVKLTAPLRTKLRTKSDLHRLYLLVTKSRREGITSTLLN